MWANARIGRIAFQTLSLGQKRSPWGAGFYRCFVGDFGLPEFFGSNKYRHRQVSACTS
jgi:hypothetical protein